MFVRLPIQYGAGNCKKVYTCTFKLYPTPPGLKDQQWGKCVIAIDEFLRRKKKDAAVERQP